MHVLTPTTVLLFVLFWLQPVAARGAEDLDSVKAAVIAAESRNTQAYLHRDWAAAAALIASDYYANVEGFEGDLAKLKEEFPKIQLFDYQVISGPHLKRLAADLVLYNDIATVRETYAGRDTSGRYWHGDIWLRRNGRWFLLVEQEVGLKGTLPFPEEAGTSQAEAERNIVQSERQWAEVCATHDTSVLVKVLADDFVGTNTEGKLYTKPEDIEKTHNSAKKYVSGRLDNLKVRFFGNDVAVVHGVETCTRRMEEGKEKPEINVWTDTWLNRNGRWQIVAAQDAIYQH